MEARHEFFHEPGDDEFWSESHYLDALGDDVQAHVRIGFYPNQDAANLFGYVIHDGAVYRVRDDEVALDHVHGLTIDAPDFRFSMVPEAVGRDWRVHLSGEAARCETASEVLDGAGDPVHLELDLVTSARHDPFLYSDGADWPGGPDEDRYEVATRVDGEVTIGGDGSDEGSETTDGSGGGDGDATTVAFEGPGERDHSWGRRDWTDGEWLWISGAFDDGAAYNHLSAWPAGYGPSEMDPVITNGFWYDGDAVHAITDADVSADPAFSAETGRAWMENGAAPTIDLTLEWAGGSADLAVEPTATTPVDFVSEAKGLRAVLNRSPAEQTRDGDVSGRGFLENMTQLELE